MPDHCGKCSGPLPIGTQQPLFGDFKMVCPSCQRTERIAMILRMLPHPDEFGFAALTPWERQFLHDLRSRGRLDLSEGQYARLEEVWAKRM